MPKKIILVCDRCGFQLTDKAEVEEALEGAESWQESVREKGGTPRGLFPCKNYVRCGGEMQLLKK